MNGSARNKTLATVITVIVVVAIFTANVLVGFIGERLHFRADMTNAGLYTLSETSKKILSELSEDVRMYVLMAEREFRQLEASELLDEYVAYGNGRIKLTYVDPLKEPNFVSRYNIVGTIQDYSVIFIVESDKRYKIEDAANMYGFLNDASGVQHVTSFNGESFITSGILYATRDELPVVSFITNHDEYYSDSLRGLLEYNGFSIEEVDLLAGNISPESKMVFISTPLADFTAEEIGKLEDYFDSYRDAIVLYGLSGAKLERFELFMKEWGIEFDNSIIFDRERAITEITQIVPFMEQSELLASLDPATTRLVSQAFRPLRFSFTQNGNRTVSPVLSTSFTSFARPLGAADFSDSIDKLETDAGGPFSVAALTTMQDFATKDDGSITYHKAEMLTVSSSPFILDSYMTNASLQNSEFISAAITYFIGDELKENEFYVTPKSISAARLDLFGVSGTVVVLLLAAVPLAILIFGFAFWLRRRHL